MILPVGASSFTEAMKMGVEVYHHLKACYILSSEFLDVEAIEHYVVNVSDFRLLSRRSMAKMPPTSGMRVALLLTSRYRLSISLQPRLCHVLLR